MARTPIPPELRAQLEADPRMKVCVVADDECDGPIQWHHAIIWAGRALQVWWAIHGICEHHHDIADRKDIRTRIVKVIHRLGGDQVQKYEKVRAL